MYATDSQTNFWHQRNVNFCWKPYRMELNKEKKKPINILKSKSEYMGEEKGGVNYMVARISAYLNKKDTCVTAVVHYAEFPKESRKKLAQENDNAHFTK